MRNYGVLKGKAKQFTRDDDNDPHEELLMDVGGTAFRIAINVRSSRGPIAERLIEYVIVEDLQHPVLTAARDLPTGWNDLQDGREDAAAIDYIRSNIFRASAMKPIKHFEMGPDNDLFEAVEDLLQQAIDRDDAEVYAFGERFGPEPRTKDKYFGFLPGNGVHLIHMNQGGAGENNGSFHDGGLIIDFPSSNRAVGLFLKFQNQKWHTEEGSGVAIPGAPAVPVIPVPAAGEVPTWQVIAADSPYHMARIVAAMVNPLGDDPGHEFVTILNNSNTTLDLQGWQILDQHDKAENISGTLAPGHAIVIPLSGDTAQLGNKGGTISLLDGRGLKVDGVAYTKEQAQEQGRPIVFG